MSNEKTSIYIRTIGGLTVSVDGDTIELPASRKTRALLVYLAMSTRPQRRDRLCEIFWDIPDDPRGSLRWSLSKIRKVLEVNDDDIVIADRDQINLDKNRITVDVDQVEDLVGTDPDQATTEALKAAEKLLCAPFLEGLELDRCPDYQPWYTAHRNRLETLRVKIISILAERHREQPEQALQYLNLLQTLIPDEISLKNRIQKLNASLNQGAVSRHDAVEGPAEESSMADADGGRPSIVILPFINFGADPDQEYFAEGVTEDIITALSRIRWLFVIARNTAFTYKGLDVNVSELARELGVRYVLKGSVQKSENRVRITAQLIDGESGNHIWAERFDRKLEHVFTVQDEITENIAGALEPQMVAAEHLRLRNKPEQNLDAWDLTIRAIALCREFTNEGSYAALELLHSALKIDPSYARAHSQIAWILSWRIHQGWESTEDALPLAEKSAEKAVYNDPDEPWAHIAWLFIATIRKDRDLLLSAAHRAVDSNPNFAMALSWLGASYALIGQGTKSFEWIEKARRLSPRDIFREEFDVHTSFAWFQVGDYHKAAEYASKASILRPDHVYPLLIRSASHAHLGMLEPARKDMERILELTPDYSLAMAHKSCVFIMQPDIERFVEGLKIAGLKD